MSTVNGIARVIRRLRSQGWKVEEIRGWPTRGIGALGPRGVVWHHTAGSSRGNTPSLALCINGASRGLPNALCNFYIARNGTIYVVAAETAWHAGIGGTHWATGNSQVLGVECENTGLGEPWGSYDAQVALAAAISAEFGFGVARHIDHKEWSPRRKIDRTGINPDTFRRDVANHSGGAAGDDDVIRRGDEGRKVVAAQVISNDWYRVRAMPKSGRSGNVRRLATDGIAGPNTMSALNFAINTVLGTSGHGDVEAEGLQALVNDISKMQARAHSHKPHEAV